MTLIVGLACKNGIVMSSDGQATTGSAGGPVRQSVSKIKQIGERTLWGASGTLGFIQDIENVLSNIPVELKNTELEQLREVISQNVHQLRKKVLEQHRDLHGPSADGAPGADLLLVEYRNGKTRILHVDFDCNQEWLEEFGFGASGIGDTFAYTILKNYDVNDCPVNQGKVLAYRVIRDAIEVGAFGLGEPIDIWVIDENGVKQESLGEMAAIRDTFRLWIETEKETFKSLFRKTEEVK